MNFFSLCGNFFDAYRANNGIKGSHINCQGLCRIVHLSSQPLHGAIQSNRPFCFFMDFAIYVIGVDQPWVAVLARKHTLLNDSFSCYSLNVSVIFRFWANHNIWDST